MADKERTYVYVQLGGQFVPAGRLTMVEEGRSGHARFQYGNRYLGRHDRVEIDPIMLKFPIGSNIEYQTAEGFLLFGAIRDAAPDEWGRHVLDRAARGRPLSEFDYLTAAGLDRIGALSFGPDLSGPRRLVPWPEDSDLDGETLDLVAMVQATDQLASAEELEARFRTFVVRGSSLGGARPKATTEWRGRPHIAKFSRQDDRMNICRLEYATMLLARACGINVPPVDLVTVLGRDIYLIERFDRDLQDQRRHFISGLTLLGAHESESQRHAYSNMADALRQHGADFVTDAHELFRRMIFNILCNNTDDHLRNHGFLHAGTGWRLSPAYDIVPYPQAGHFRMLALGVGERGREASLENALSSRASFGLRQEQAQQIVSEVQGICRGWEGHYQRCGVTGDDLRRVATCFAWAG